MVRGLALYAGGNVPEAAAALSRVVRLQPRNGYAWCILGDMYRSNNDRAASENAYKEALRIDPSNVEAKNGLRDLGPQ